MIDAARNQLVEIRDIRWDPRAGQCSVKRQRQNLVGYGTEGQRSRDIDDAILGPLVGLRSEIPHRCKRVADAFEDVSEEDLAREQQTIDIEIIPDEVSEAITAALIIEDDDATEEALVVIEEETAELDLEALLEEAEELLDVDELVDAVVADLDIPENEPEMAETGVEKEDTEGSIRAMMERLEKAAAKALGGGSGADDDQKDDPESSQRVA